MGIGCRRCVAFALLITAILAARPGIPEEQVAAMITRIEPADTGIAQVTGNGREDEAAFMMSLYAGDVVTVRTPNTTVHVKVFGAGEETATNTMPLTIGEAVEKRGLFNSMYAALTDKVFRNNQLYRRNLTTRADGDEAPLKLSGFDTRKDAQAVQAGARSLFFRWNVELDDARYEFAVANGGERITGGSADGDYLIVDDLSLVAGQRYEIVLRSADGRQATGGLEAVSRTPALQEVSSGLGTVGLALQLLALAGLDDGRWKFEAIQGVVDLSPDEIDRATLIDEISRL